MGARGTGLDAAGLLAKLRGAALHVVKDAMRVVGARAAVRLPDGADKQRLLRPSHLPARLSRQPISGTGDPARHWTLRRDRPAAEAPLPWATGH